MGNREFLDSLFELFGMILDFYKGLKDDKKFNLKVPSQNDIGALFGSLATNYTYYKNEKRFPNLWGKNIDEEAIINDIYNRLQEGFIIPEDKRYVGLMVDYLESIIKNKQEIAYTEYDLNKNIGDFIKDLQEFKKQKQYKEFLKCFVDYANKKPGLIYKSRFTKTNLVKINTDDKLGKEKSKHFHDDWSLVI